MAIDLAIDDDSLISAKRGAVFVAPANSDLPADLSTLTLAANGTTITPWMNLGHTSESNLPSWDVSGGDANSLNSWLRENVKTTHDSKTITLSAKVLQADKKTLQFVYNGWENEKGGIAVSINPASQNVGLIILSYDPDTQKPFGIYVPSTSLVSDGMPDFSGDFTEFGFSATVQASDALTKSAAGESAAFAFLTPEDFIKKP